MLKTVREKTLDARGLHFAIVASEYNARYVNSMLSAARAVLKKAGAKDVAVVRVPGAFEIPVAASAFAVSETPLFDAVICLGVILRGATTHAQHIGEAVTNSLAQIQIQRRIPVIHEVLLLENEQQAKERCLDAKNNRGKEAALTAIYMGRLMRKMARNLAK